MRVFRYQTSSRVCFCAFLQAEMESRLELEQRLKEAEEALQELEKGLSSLERSTESEEQMRGNVTQLRSECPHARTHARTSTSTSTSPESKNNTSYYLPESLSSSLLNAHSWHR